MGEATTAKQGSVTIYTVLYVVHFYYSRLSLAFIIYQRANSFNRGGQRGIKGVNAQQHKFSTFSFCELQ